MCLDRVDIQIMLPANDSRIGGADAFVAFLLASITASVLRSSDPDAPSAAQASQQASETVALLRLLISVCRCIFHPSALLLSSIYFCGDHCWLSRPFDSFVCIVRWGLILRYERSMLFELAPI